MKTWQERARKWVGENFPKDLAAVLEIKPGIFAEDAYLAGVMAKGERDAEFFLAAKDLFDLRWMIRADTAQARGPGEGKE